MYNKYIQHYTHIKTRYAQRAPHAYKQTHNTINNNHGTANHITTQTQVKQHNATTTNTINTIRTQQAMLYI